MMVVRATRVLTCVVVLSMSAVLTAQHATPPATPPKLGIVADGRKNPELIPERAAVAAFFTPLALPAGAGGASSPLRDLRIKDVRLSKKDEALLRTELTVLGGKLRSKNGEIEAASARARQERTPEARAAFTSGMESRDDLTWESYQNLKETLSPKGAKRLADKIAEVRSQMKAFGPVR